MDYKQYRAALEAILFASGEPVSRRRLAQALELDEGEVTSLADELAAAYRERGSGMQVVRLDEHYQMCTGQEYAEYVRRALDIRRNTPLTQAAMEVLAIVAYNQPVTKAFVEQVRGVDCAAVMQGLLQKELIEERGRLELPGRPLLYGTTPHFLRCFGLDGIGGLPPLPQAEEADAEAEPTLHEYVRELET